MRETEIVIQWLGGYRDQTSIVSGYLRDSAGTGLPDLDLEFYFDGMYVGNFTTQNLGLYSFDFLVQKILHWDLIEFQSFSKDLTFTWNRTIHKILTC